MTRLRFLREAAASGYRSLSLSLAGLDRFWLIFRIETGFGIFLTRFRKYTPTPAWCFGVREEAGSEIFMPRVAKFETFAPFAPLHAGLGIARVRSRIIFGPPVRTSRVGM